MSAALGFEHVYVPGRGDWTLLLLHGTGGDERQLLELGRALAPEAALVSPRGKVLEGGVAPRFFRRHGVNELDIEDLIERAEELAGFAGAAMTAYGRDPARLVAAGYSNGANIAVGLLFRRPEAVRGAILFRPTLPYEPDGPLSLAGKEVLVAAGTRDPYASGAKTERLAALLREGGATVALHAREAGHELAPADLKAAAAWFSELAAKQAP